jgi:hypothetical protein
VIPSIAHLLLSSPLNEKSLYKNDQARVKLKIHDPIIYDSDHDLGTRYRVDDIHPTSVLPVIPQSLVKVTTFALLFVPFLFSFLFLF